MSAALIFTPEGACNCKANYDEKQNTILFRDMATSQLNDYFSEELDKAIRSELGHDAYQKILDEVGHKPTWRRMIYDKEMVYPCRNILIHDILMSIYGDVGQIFGYVILLE